MVAVAVASPGRSTDAPNAEREHLKPLTSLRFVAAFMIVLSHTGGMFPSVVTWLGSFALTEGVPFFFVLSGFILAHAYPTLDEAGTRRFLVARFARLWPVHATALVLAILAIALGGRDALPYETATAALAVLLMVHAWIPYPDSYFAFNAPSWSISTELGFYLLFPVLIRNWERTWAAKLAGALLLTVAVRALGGATGADQQGVSVSPLGPLHLFVLGMASCLAWRRVRDRVAGGAFAWTLAEVLVLVLVAWSLASPVGIWSLLAWLAPGSKLGVWVSQIRASAPLFALLIVVFALRRGLVSRALSWSPFVLLGEASYALYLVHYQVLLLLAWRLPALMGLGEWGCAAIYWAISLGLAWLLWRYVERPGRDSIRRWYARNEDALTGQQWRWVGAGIAGLMVAILALRAATLR